LNKQERISIVVPCYNEKESIGIFDQKLREVIRRTKDYSFEVLYVDDGSTDGTLCIMEEIAEKNKETYFLSFSRNFGKEQAIYAGLQFSRGDYVVLMDGDLQHPPEKIHEMIHAVAREGYDVAATCRSQRKGRASAYNIWAGMFYRLFNAFSEIRLKEGAQDFRLMRRSVVEAVLSMKESNRFSKGIFEWVGFSTKWIENEVCTRVAGKTKWTFSTSFQYALDGILSFSKPPFRTLLVVGGLLTAVSLLFFLGLLAGMLFKGDDQGMLILIVLWLSLIGGVLIASIGLVGEYVWRIHGQSKDRPMYIIKKTNWKRGEEHETFEE